jgi:hypothetical protein
LENAVATAAGLTVLIMLFGSVSSAHFSRSSRWWTGRAGTAVTGRDLLAYSPAHRRSQPATPPKPTVQVFHPSCVPHQRELSEGTGSVERLSSRQRDAVRTG